MPAGHSSFQEEWKLWQDTTGLMQLDNSRGLVYLLNSHSLSKQPETIRQSFRF